MTGNTLKQSIQNDIHSSTYAYFRNVDLYFRDFIYGDPFYVCLVDVIYRYLFENTISWELDYTMVGIIDMVELVSGLYGKYIKADRYFRSRHSGNDRDRKNYLMVSLRKATGRLLQQQYDTHHLLCQDIDNIDLHPEFRFISLFSRDGQLMDDLSWQRWKMDQADAKDTEYQRQQLDVCIGVLNDMERSVINLLLDGRSNPEICSRLHLEPGALRKVVYSAKQKLQKRHLESKPLGDDSLN
jgi:DNA-directed RNA polymerase specialized sigma24 family protein